MSEDDKPKPSTPTPAPPPPPAPPIVPGPIGPLVPPYRGPGRVTNAVPAARWAVGRNPGPLR
ncbi:hypothetical protein [Micromonospora sp. NPDC092111]|uniref:hypothetical protein n=1 Tax=Micromonospora sp. NPDC092111 TaxID=3364289 RepID=UPI00382E0B04